MALVYLSFNRNQYLEVTARTTHKANNFTVIYDPPVLKIWEPRHLTIQWISLPVKGLALLFSLRKIIYEFQPRISVGFYD
jgi:hypothetical protein